MSERKEFLLRLEADEHAALRRLAQLTDTSMNAIVVEALHEYFQGTGREKFVKASATRTQDRFEKLLDRLAQ